MTTRAPVSLTVAAAVVGVEALGVVAYGVALVPAVHRERLALGLSTAVFFLLYGVALGYCARSLVRPRSWARSPLLLSQLLQLGVGYNLWVANPALRVLAVVMAVLAVVVLVALFLPISMRALEAADHEGDDPG